MARNNDRWVTELRAEQESALTYLRDVLLRNLRKALSNHSRADESFMEDAVQDSLIRILDRLDQFEGRSRFITWATTIAIHVSMSELRRSRWKDVSLDEVMADADAPLHELVEDILAKYGPAQYQRTDIKLRYPVAK